MRSALRTARGGITAALAAAVLVLVTLGKACSSDSDQQAQDGGTDSGGGEAGAIAANRPETRPATDALIAQLSVPDGFEARVFARDLMNPRMMATGPDGSIYVTSPMTGQVLRLRDSNGDGDAADPGEQTAFVGRTDAEGLEGVHGIAIHEGRIYLASVKNVFMGTLGGAQVAGIQRIVSDLPDGGQHPNRTIGVGPDGKLYVSVGSTCNACPESNSEHATMLRLNLDGTPAQNPPNPNHPMLARDPTAMISPRVFSSGLRNTLGFDWHPTTGELWGADHGSDGLGDDVPPDELNRIGEGTSYGWPYCWGDRQVDPTIDQPSRDMTKEAYCAETAAPFATYQAHSAPIAFLFYRATAFPEEYRGDAFVAFRGSWNRSQPTGYKVVRVNFEGGMPVPIAGGAVYDDFLSGFLIEGGAANFGRIAGLTVDGAGALLVSDDTNGMIYRVSHGPGARADAGAPQPVSN